MRRRSILALLALLLLAPVLLALGPAALAGAAEQPFRQAIHAARPAAPDGTVTIRNLKGAIVVRGWERREVAVSGIMADARHTSLRFEAKRDATAVLIEGQALSLMQRIFTGASPDPVDLEVWVPRGSRVVVDTVTAGVRVRDVDGPVEVGSAHGRVEMTGTPARVEVRTVSGGVRFAGRTRDVVVETVSGHVDVAGVERRLEVRSVSGSIEAAGEALERVSLESVSGDLRFAGSVRPPGKLEAETASGEITLRLPRDLEAAYRLSAPRGRIVNEIGPPPRTEGEGMILNFGRRGALVSATTVSGQLELAAATERTVRTAPR